MRDGNRVAAGSMRVWGLGLVMLLALAGSLVAQEGAAQAGTQPRVALAKPAAEPHAMTEDNFAAAVQWVQAATGANGTTGETLHLRYELQMVDVNGKQHSGSFETWSSPDGHRMEIHTDTYNGVMVSKGGRVWTVADGPWPLRVMEFAAERVVPSAAIERTLTGEESLKAKTDKGVSLLCGGDGQTAVICFDPSTGFITDVTLDEAAVAYEGWKKVSRRYLAGVVRVSHGKHLLVEATMTVASNEFSPDVFAVPEGAVQAKAGTTMNSFTMPGNDPTNPTHPGINSRMMIPDPTSIGEAQMKVWVDQHGHVTKAMLEDADDKEIEKMALNQALRSVLPPYRVDEKFLSYETNMYISIGRLRPDQYQGPPKPAGW